MEPADYLYFDRIPASWRRAGYFVKPHPYLTLFLHHCAKSTCLCLPHLWPELCHHLSGKLSHVTIVPWVWIQISMETRVRSSDLFVYTQLLCRTGPILYRDKGTPSRSFSRVMCKCTELSSKLGETSISLHLKPHGMPFVISTHARKLPPDLAGDYVKMASILFGILPDHQVQACIAQRSVLPWKVVIIHLPKFTICS